MHTPPIGQVVIPRSEWLTLLEDLIGARLSSDTLCLYTGAHTPGLGDGTFSYLPHEANFGGYARVPLTTWTSPALNADSIAATTAATATFAATGSGLPITITGVFGLDSLGDIAFAQILPSGPITLTRAGQVVQYTPTLTLGVGC
jgi:hypothetical protein